MIDLHTHSTASDGCYTPSELVRLAKEKGVSVLALTDHDSVSGNEEAKKTADEEGIIFVPGVELNIEWPTGEFHLLGLGLKEVSPKLSELIESQQNSRRNRNELIVKKMNETFKDSLPKIVTLEDLYQKYSTDVIGRPHLAQFLVESKIVKTRQKAFDLYLAKGRPLYEKKSGSSLDSAIVAVRESGGIPVIAHPLSLYLSWGKLESELEKFFEQGIEGLEAWHPGIKVNAAMRLEEIAGKIGYFVTAGSDFHGEKVRADRKIGHTAGGKKIDDKFWTENLLPHLKNCI